MDFKHSAFYYGHIVKSETSLIPFKEGTGNEVVATMALGSYTLSEFATEMARVLTEAGTQTYDVTINRVTRLLTVTAPGPFTLLFGSSENSGSSIKGLAGFPDLDTASLSSHTSLSPSGETYYPQAPISKYTPFEHWKGATGASVTRSASGRATVVSFGDIERMRCNISGITDKAFAPSSIILNNPNAKAEALAFLEYITKQNPVEFMFDRNDPNTYVKCLLESTKDSKDGISFELYEGLGKGLNGVYQTDILVFRRIS